jgi:hypothetical protein
MTKVRHEFGTVESYEAMMRGAAADGSNLYPFAIGVIRSIVGVSYLSDTEKVRRVAAVLVARDKTDGNPEAVALERLQRNQDAIRRLEEENADIRKEWIAKQLSAPADQDPDPTGLNYTRADDDTADPTPPGPREPLHTGAMTEHGLVDETAPKCTPKCDALTTRPEITGMARNFHADNCPVVVHHHVTDGETACGKQVSDLPAAHGYETGSWDATDCQACIASRAGRCGWPCERPDGHSGTCSTDES